MKPLLLAAFAMSLFAGSAAADQNCFWGEDRGVTIQAPYQSRLDISAYRSAEEPRLSRSYGLNSWRRARLGRTGPNPFAGLFGGWEAYRASRPSPCGEIGLGR